jgi:subtilisin family serine protease
MALIMDEITLLRGDQTVTYQKAPLHFAVRMRQGRAYHESELERQVGKLPGMVRHVESLVPHNLELFAVEKPEMLEVVMAAVRYSPASGIVTHVYTLKDPSGAPPPRSPILGRILAPTGALTVQFEPGTPAKTARRILDALGLAVGEVLDSLPNGYTVNLLDSATENPLKLAARLQETPEIVRAEPDLCFRIDRKRSESPKRSDKRSESHLPAGPLFRRQWHLHNPGGASVQAPEAWAITRGARSVVVCLIDDGFDLDHPSFDAGAGNGGGKIVAPWNFCEDNADPRPARPSDNHGTACAGVAVAGFAQENDQGVVGLAPGCALMPLRCGDWLSDALLAAMLQYAVYHGADVIACGWSAEAWYFPLSTRVHAALHQAATRGRRNQQGCVILFAAGDENRPLDGHKAGQRSYQGFALHPDALAVGASDSQDRRASYSNYGPGLGLVAPSSGVRRILTTDRRGPAGYAEGGAGNGDYTFDFGGTSSAVSLAAGLTALVLSADPALPAAAVRQILCDSAEKIDPANGAYAGRRAGGYSSWYGYGRIHAARAVACAKNGGKVGAGWLPRQLLLENRPYRAIPDRGALVESLPCGLNIATRALAVELEIRSLYQGRVRLSLLPPAGKPVVLLDTLGRAGALHDLSASYHSTRDPGLFDALIGLPARGDWRLKIESLDDFNTGVLVRWSLTITYDDAVFASS